MTRETPPPERGLSQPPFVSRQPVFFDMLDALGMLHNAAFLILFERARFDFWHAHQVILDDAHFDWPYFVARNVVDYHAPIRPAQDVQVGVWVEKLGRTSITFGHSVDRADGVRAAEGLSVLVRVDGPTGRPVAWSDAFRALVSPYLWTPPAPPAL